MVSAGGVEGEVADEAAVDEDVAGGSGDDGEGRFGVVGAPRGRSAGPLLGAWVQT